MENYWELFITWINLKNYLIIKDMKLNKKQLEALEYLKIDLDELSNKPRRFFSSLFKFIDAFIEHKDKEHYDNIVADIMEWQEMFYRNINHYEILEDCGRTSREVKKELIKKIPDNWTDDAIDNYRAGVEEATKQMAIMMTKNLIERLY